MGLRYRDLGPVWLERDGSPVKVPGGRLSAALSVLLAQANHRVSTDSLLDALWGQDASEQNAQTLESHVFRLRKLLEPEHQAGQPYSTVLHNAQGYQLLAAADQVDSLWFEQLAAQARDLMVSGQPERARARCEQALNLWRGRPWTPSTDAAWAAPAAARLEELRADVASQRIDALLTLGQIPLALADLEKLIGATPLRERLWTQRMLGLHRAGRTDEALQAYQRLRELLIDELGVEPGPDIRSLHARILAEDPDLAPPPAAAPEPAPTTERREGNPSPKALGEAVILPHRRIVLIGREQQMADLAALVVSRHLVSVIGTAGCGKTSIAIEVARRAAAHFPDGVVFVDLSGATELNQTLDAITSTLQLPGSAAESRTQTLIAFTRTRRMLLILDNCEQILEDIADLADALLGTDTELSILVTSREPLNLDGEAVFALSPLPVAEPAQSNLADTHALAEQPAVELFLTRLHAAAPHQTIGPADIRLIARICAAVDGIPLAIELAAAQSRAYTLVEILNRVQHDLVGLARIGRGANRHHSSLRTAIEFSTAALSPDELAMHHALAVVSGPVTPALAAALADQSGPAAQMTLSQLLHRSMVTSVAPDGADRPSRFAQLATIRSHAHSASNPEQRAVLENRRDAWVRNLVARLPQMGDENHTIWTGQVADNITAVRATLQRRLIDEPNGDGVFLAARLAHFWYEMGMVSEWERWTRLAHAQTGQRHPVDHLLTGLSHAAVTAVMGSTVELLYAIDAVDAQPQEFNRAEQLLLGDSVLSCVFAALAAGDTAVAIRAEATGRRFARQTSDVNLLLIADVCRVTNEIFTGVADPAHVQRQVQRLWETAHRVENNYASWAVATSAAGISIMVGDPEMAQLWSTRLLADFPRTGIGGVSVVLETRAAALALNGQQREAVQVFSASRSYARRAGLPWPLSPTTHPLFNMATAVLSTQEREQAERVGTQMSIDDIAAATTS